MSRHVLRSDRVSVLEHLLSKNSPYQVTWDKLPLNYRTVQRIRECKPVNYATVKSMQQMMPIDVLEKYNPFVEYFFNRVEALSSSIKSANESTVHIQKRLAKRCKSWKKYFKEQSVLSSYFFAGEALPVDHTDYSYVQYLAIELLEIHRSVIRYRYDLTEENWEDWVQESILFFYEQSPVYRQLLEDQEIYASILSVVEDRNIKPVEYVQFNIKGHGFSRRRFKFYTDKLIDEIEKASEQIIILSYDSYHGGHLKVQDWESEQIKKDHEYMMSRFQEYYLAIERKIAEGVKCIRISQVCYKESELEKKASRLKSIRDAFSGMNKALKEHIERLMEQETTAANFDFRILGMPLTPMSFLIVDQKCVLTELIRRNASGVAYPFELFVNRITPDDETASSIIDYRLKWLQRVLDANGNESIMLPELHEARMSKLSSRYNRQEFSNTRLKASLETGSMHSV